jgi:sphingolipid delta-4 desaturase
MSSTGHHVLYWSSWYIARVSSAPLSFDVVDYPEPHLARTRELLRAHPEVKALFGPTRVSFLLTLAVVGLQVGAGALCGRHGWAFTLLLAYTLGASANHALWVLIHECTHNLVFRSSRANSALQIFANGPIVFPAAISFRKFHLLHHRFQGDPELDADLASPDEAWLVQNVWWRKALWLLTFFVWQALRVRRLKRVKLWDGWYAANVLWQLLFLAGVWALGGIHGVVYLTLGSIFAIGLHPLGARWIQEHYLTSPDQETYSYYGPLNTIALNVGYHNEHHDLMRVPWTRLPRVTQLAPELYRPLKHHTSWTRLLVRFIFDPRLSLYSRRIRTSTGRSPTAEDAQDGDPQVAELAGIA